MVDALLEGKLGSLPPDILFLLSRTGLIHLFASAGLHLAVALSLSRALSRIAARFFADPRAPALAAFLFSLGFLLLLGKEASWSSPMVRAFTYSTLLCAATLLEIRASRPWLFFLSLAAAAAFGQSSWLSFLLSALGMAAILFVQPRNLLTLAIAPWAATVPLAVWYFQIFPLWAPFWNLTVGLGITFTVLPAAVVALLLKTLSLPDALAKAAAEAFLSFWIRVLRQGDQILGGAYWVKPEIFLFTAGLLLGAWALRRRRKSAAAMAVTAVLAALLAPPPSLAVLDVGQGDAIYLNLSSGERLMEDQGPPPFRTGVAPSSRSLERLGVGPLDSLVFSHMDRDHVGGAPFLLERHPLRKGAWFREVHLTDPRALPILAALERAETPVFFLGEHPLPDFRCWLPPPVDSNDSSSFCRAQLAGGRSIWLTGDAAFPSEAWLLAQGPLPPADFLKIGHHGSKTSSSVPFLRATEARVALISVGSKNRYGHPTKQAMQRMQETGMEIRRTDLEGNLRYW